MSGLLGVEALFVAGHMDTGHPTIGRELPIINYIVCYFLNITIVMVFPASF